MLAEHRATRPPGKRILRTPIAAPPRMKYFVRLGFRRIETIVYLTNVPADLSDQTLCDIIQQRGIQRAAPWPQDVVFEPLEEGLQRVVLAYANAGEAGEGAKSLLGVPLYSERSQTVVPMRVTSLAYQRTRYNKLGYITEEIGACRGILNDLCSCTTDAT